MRGGGGGQETKVLNSLRVTRILTQGDGRRRSDSVGHIVPSPGSGRLERTSVSKSRARFLANTERHTGQ